MRQVPGLHPVAGRIHGMALFFERLHEEAGDLGFVLHHQHPHQNSVSYLPGK